jgi:hypothetical protein
LCVVTCERADGDAWGSRDGRIYRRIGRVHGIDKFG